MQFRLIGSCIRELVHHALVTILNHAMASAGAADLAISHASVTSGLEITTALLNPKGPVRLDRSRNLDSGSSLIAFMEENAKLCILFLCVGAVACLWELKARVAPRALHDAVWVSV